MATKTRRRESPGVAQRLIREHVDADPAASVLGNENESQAEGATAASFLPFAGMCLTTE